MLQPGSYSITPGIHRKDGLSLEYIESILDFDVLKIASGEGDGYIYDWDMGIVRFNSDWKLNE